MKAISLWQPWATLVAVGLKKIETRSWDAKYTGPLAIHAAKRRMTTAESQMLWESGVTLPMNAILSTAKLPYGCVVAVCHLDRTTNTCDYGTDWANLGSGEEVTGLERRFGDYSPGRFAWFLSAVQKLNKPVPFRGGQKWFNVPDELLKEVL